MNAKQKNVDRPLDHARVEGHRLDKELSEVREIISGLEDAVEFLDRRVNGSMGAGIPTDKFMRRVNQAHAVRNALDYLVDRKNDLVSRSCDVESEIFHGEHALSRRCSDRWRS